MRHRKRGKKLGVSIAHRRALGRHLVQALIDNERIVTTFSKAKAYQPLAEKIITLGREKTLSNLRRARSLLGNRELEFSVEGKQKVHTVLQKLFDDVGPRNRDRKGGYTRVLRLAKRRLGDGGERCIFELVDGNVRPAKTSPAKPKASEAAAS